ncbi:MAG: UvrD-helicase domain-containing protein, partial [Planctomycetota bacterium JB042]
AHLDELEGMADEALLALRRHLVERLRARVDARKASRGVWSFDDLLVRLRRALGGAGGAGLRAALRGRFRAVLIDEFQDTDEVQWDIFHDVFPSEDGWLCLIGDPKQAIYRFRGADLGTYLRARDAAKRSATLPENWRSDPRAVRAVNAVFTRAAEAPSPFLDERVEFRPVSARKDDRIRCAGEPGPGLRVLVRRAADDGPEAKGEFEADLPARVATEVVRMLHDGAITIVPEPGPGETRPPAPEPLLPKHVAILTRTNRQARDVQAELRARKVPSILHGDASVFSTPEATDLLRILEATLDPSREAIVKAALATDLLGRDAAALDGLAVDGNDEWVGILDGLRELRRRWEERGLVAMLHQLFQSHGVVARMLAVVGGERRMTNVVHLVELLHRAAREERLGPAALVRWLGRQIRREEEGGYTDREAAQIRLESDADAVQIATVHRSKGLEYPVVFVPWLWSSVRKPTEWFLEVEDPDRGRRCIDLRGRDHPAVKEAALRATREEDIRLAYVALTRARHLTVVHHGLVNELELSPLGHLLHGEGKVDAVTFRDDLASLAARSDGSIEIVDESPPSPASWTRPDRSAPELAAATLGRRLDRAFRTSSFSALVSGSAGAPGSPEETGAERDDPALEPARDRGAGAVVPLREFVRGTRAGRFLHRVLELADFRVDARDALRDVVDKVRRAYAVPAVHTSESIADALGLALDAPLDGATRLADVPPERRWNELPFLFPVAPGGAPVRPADLAAVVRREGPPAVPIEVADRIEALDFRPLRGFLRGYIDLVFADAPGPDGRFWVVDFKSNDLGPRYGDYEPDALRRAMREHDYDLQALLYLVAVHRFLRVRLAEYDPARHLGGARYLFLRGMAPDHAGRGVVEIPATTSLVEGLDAVRSEER